MLPVSSPDRRADAASAPFRLHKHAVAAFFIALAFQVFFSGFPGTLAPVRLFWGVIGSALFGLPLGYLVNRAGGGVERGVMIGVALSVAVFGLLGLLPATGLADDLLLPGAMGGMVGAFVGVHIETDN